jgi:hypothetical protein
MFSIRVVCTACAMMAPLLQTCRMNPDVLVRRPQRDAVPNPIVPPDLAHLGQDRPGKEPLAVVEDLGHGPAHGGDLFGEGLLYRGGRQSIETRHDFAP